MTTWRPANFRSAQGYDNLSATGTGQADAAPIYGGVNVYTDVPSGSGVVLPSSYASEVEIFVFNRGANALNVYPDSGAEIESLGTNAAYSVAVGASVSFYCVDKPFSAGRQWRVGVNSQTASGVSSVNTRTGAVVLTATDIPVSTSFDNTSGTLQAATISASSLLGNAGTVAAIPAAVAVGSGLSLSAAGTLNATGSGGTVTEIVAGSGLAGGTITTSGTVSLATIAAGDLLGNPGTVAAVPSGIAIGTGLSLSSVGTLSAVPEWSAGTVTAVAGGLSISSNTLTTPARNSAFVQADWGAGATVNNGTIVLCGKMPYAGTIESANWYAGVGTFDAEIQLNGTDIGGMSTVVVDSATHSGPANLGTTAATSANTFAQGAYLTAIITNSTGTPTPALLGINVTWS